MNTQKYQNIADKFFKNMPDPCFNEKDCWEWQGSKTNNRGYGDLVLGSKHYKKDNYYRERSHRFSFMYFNEIEIPKDKLVCHSCDNPKCCNPFHLYLGTPQQNMDDRKSRGRQPSTKFYSETAKLFNPKGSKQWQAKLKESDITNIFRAAKSGMTLESIGKTYGVTKNAIHAVLKRKTWKHVEVN